MTRNLSLWALWRDLSRDASYGQNHWACGYVFGQFNHFGASTDSICVFRRRAIIPEFADGFGSHTLPISVLRLEMAALIFCSHDNTDFSDSSKSSAALAASDNEWTMTRETNMWSKPSMWKSAVSSRQQPAVFSLPGELILIPSIPSIIDRRTDCVRTESNRDHLLSIPWRAWPIFCSTMCVPNESVRKFDGCVNKADAYEMIVQRILSIVPSRFNNVQWSDQ